MSNLSKINKNDLSKSEISLVDVIEFLQESWKTIAGFTSLGIAGAVLFLWLIPKQYEASAQIKMAQIANFNNNNNINSMSISVEEPQALIARMALPSSYPKETIALCGLAEQKEPELTLASKVKFSIPKGVGNIVDLKIRDASKEIAKACTNAVYQIIKISQAQLIAPYIDVASKKLKIEEEHLSRAAHLTAPIYLMEEPVFPQKLNSLLIGLLLGGLLGVALALARKWFGSNRTALNHR